MNSPSSCLHVPSAEITHICYAQLGYVFADRSKATGHQNQENHPPLRRVCAPPILRTRENMETIPPEVTNSPKEDTLLSHPTLRLSLRETHERVPSPEVSPVVLGRNMQNPLKTHSLEVRKESLEPHQGNATNLTYGAFQNLPQKLLPGVLQNII